MSILSSQINQSQISQMLQQQRAQLMQPLQLWQGEIQTDQGQISAWGKIAGALSGLKSALGGISNPGSLDNRGASTSASSVVTATASRNAASGSYRIGGAKLARAQNLYSGTYASASATLGSGSGSLTFSFAGGGSSAVTISKSEMSLNGIAQAINQAGLKVRASVVQTGGGAELTLQGSGTGSSNAFTVRGTGSLSQLDYGSGSAGSMTLAQAARNATFTVNGVPVSEPANKTTGVVGGVTLDLAGSGSATVTVSRDSSKLAGALSAVISKLNSAVGTVSKETAYQPGSGSGSGQGSAKSGPLLGNVSAERVGNDLLSAVSGAYSGSMTATGIGITVSKTGSVSFDKGAFATAYQKNPSQVEALVGQLFGGIDNVVGPATGGYATGASQTYNGGGTVASEKSALNQDIKNLKQQIQDRTSFVSQQMQTISSEYAQMEQALQASQVSAAYLSVFSGSGSGSGSGGG